MSEKTTSEFMLEIASHYLINGCDGCPFYSVTKTCDSKPINCNWMALRNYFKAEESKEESEPAEPERKTGKWVGDCCSCCGVSKYNYIKMVDDECGPFGTWNFCPNCGADMSRGE